MNLSPHFSLHEMTYSATAFRLGIDNSPSGSVIRNLSVLALLLEQVRDLLGHPITVTSAYRSPSLNCAIGGARKSDHLVGLAADFICPGFGGSLEVCRAISASRIEFQQLIFEGSWTHIAASLDATSARREVLSASVGAAGVRYSVGLPV